jgi:hypothetical protein
MVMEVISGKVVSVLCEMALLAGFAVTSSEGAEIKYRATENRLVTISINGEIAKGDGESFRSQIKEAEIKGYVVSEVQLNSGGGSLFEGTSVARAIRKRLLNTVVVPGGTCASACFVIFAAGATRSVHPTARVGLHAASTESGEENQDTSAATAAMVRIAELLGVPPAISSAMISTPPSQMYWLSNSQLEQMGAVVAGEPRRPD